MLKMIKAQYVTVIQARHKAEYKSYPHSAMIGMLHLVCILSFALMVLEQNTL